MSDTDDRMRHALRAEAETVASSDATWADVSAALARRRRSRRLQRATLGAVAAAAIVAGVLAMGSTDSDDSSLRVVPPATEATEPTVETTVADESATPSTTLPPPAPLDGAPKQLVVVDVQSGDVVVLATATGRPLRTLTTRAGTISVTPDGSSVYVSRLEGSGDSCQHHGIFLLPVAGGPGTRIATGFSPAVSPDGKKLAYVADDPRSEECYSERLVVRDLASGTERSFSTYTSAKPPDALSHLSWAPDSRHLAAGQGWENSVRVIVLDTASEGSMQKPTTVPDGDGVYFSPVYLGDSLVVRWSDDDLFDPTPDQIVSVEPSTGRVLSTLVPDVFGTPVAADSTGRHLLYSRAHPGTGVESLWRWSGGRSVQIADVGYVFADW